MEMATTAMPAPSASVCGFLLVFRARDLKCGRETGTILLYGLLGFKRLNGCHCVVQSNKFCFVFEPGLSP